MSNGGGPILKRDRKTIMGGSIIANGGVDLYVNANPTPATIGGIPAGTTFPAPGKTLQQMFDFLLYPVSFTAFALNVGPTVEVGYSFNGNKSFSWTISGSAVANTLDILQGVTLIETNIGLASPKVHNFVVPVTYVVPTTVVYTVRADTTNYTFSKTYNLSWLWRGYVGTSANAGPLNEAQIEALTDYAGLEAGFTGTYATSAGNYKYFAWPTTFGSPASFKDAATNLDIAMEASYVVNITNVQGVAQDYNVFRTTNILGAAINVVVA